MLSRRTLLKSLVAAGLSGLSIGAYAFGIEPRFRLDVTRYRINPPNWPTDLALKLAVVADVHAGEPYMSPRRIAEIVQRTNALGADAVLLLGDFAAGHRWQTRRVPPQEWAGLLKELKAPLGVHAVLGNHDWWDDRQAQRRKHGPVIGQTALERVGIPVYENDAVRLVKDRQPFWLAGLGDQIALLVGRQGRRPLFRGVDDLEATLAKVHDDAPIVLMAHEPDIFPRVPSRVAVTISGHTHGGQVRIAGYSPVVPSRFGNRYAYGHIVEGNRHLVVSGGLGCSVIPVRLGVPPEIVHIEIGGQGPGGSQAISPA